MKLVFFIKTLGGNYSICAENLSKTRKTLTLDFSLAKDIKPAETLSGIDLLQGKINFLFSSLNTISRNIEKLRTREFVHFDCKCYNT